MLESKGFAVVVEQEAGLGGSNIFSLYARKPGGRRDDVLRDESSDVLPTGFDHVAVSPVELRRYLREKLPDYMIPTAFVTLDELPLTNNGKVNRSALPAPEEVEAETSAAVAPPRGLVEEILLGIWSEVLGVRHVGIDDNFFTLGGHSLLATQLVSRVRAAFKLEVPLRALFSHPTVAELAREIETGLREGAGLDAPPIVAVPRGGALPLSFAQQRLWFLARFAQDSSNYNNMGMLRLIGDLNVEVLGRTLSELVRRHESLRTTFSEEGGQPVQVIHPPTPVALNVEDLGGLDEAQREAEVRRLSEAEAQQPFDLSTGPMLRVRLLRLADEHHVLLFTLHHIITDGWSSGVLIREVSQLYAAYSKGEPSPLEELSIQYADFAVWQRQWMSGEVLERELDYWRHQLAGAPPVLELPTDWPRPAVQSFRGAMHSFVLPPELTDHLRRLSRAEGVTLFMTLLAGFQALLARYTGSPMWSSARTWPTATAPRPRRSSASSSTCSSSEPTSRASPDSASWWGASERSVSEPTRIRRYRSRSWSRSWSPSAASDATRSFRWPSSYRTRRAGSCGCPGCGCWRWRASTEGDVRPDAADGGAGRDFIAATFEYDAELFEAASIERLARHLVTLFEGAVAEPSPPRRDARPAERDRAATAHARVQPDGASIPAQGVAGGVVRATGGADAAGHRGRRWGREGELRGVERAREPAGASLAGGGRGA